MVQSSSESASRLISQIAVVGGGISGLLCAYFLKARGARVQVFEASRRVGGWICSEEIEGRWIEWGPQTLMANQAWRDLIAQLQLKVFEPASSGRFRYIWFQGRRLRLPLGLFEFLATPLLSAGAKFKILTEVFRSTHVDESDLTMAQFFERVFHRDVVNNLLDPFVGGIYAGDVHKLSASAGFPKLWDAVQEHHSVVRGMFKKRSGDRPKMLSFARGLGEIVFALEKKLGENLSLESPVSEISSLKNKWQVRSNGALTEFDHVILAIPSKEAARLVGSHLPQGEISFLNNIFYQRVGVWATVFERPNNFETGFGCLVPRAAGEPLLGSLWGSEIFSGRSKAGELISTQFFAGDKLPDDPMKHLPFLQKVLGLNTVPRWQGWRVHENAIPQFALGHREFVKRLRTALPTGIHLCGHYLDGVGLTNVMNTAKDLVDKISSEAKP